VALKTAAQANASRIAGRKVDVTSESAVRQFIERIVAEHGRLDAPVNTVGGYAGAATMRR